MESPLRLEATLNTNTIPASSQARLVYALLQIRASNLPRERVPLSLDLVVDVSLSMHIPIVDEEQFEILAGMGAVSEVMRDGIPTWKFERVPPGFRESCPSPLAFVKQAIQVTLEILHPEDRCGLVAFAQTSRRLAPVLPVSHKTGLLRASEQLDAIDLGDETCLAEGLALAVRELADPGVPPAYGVRRIFLLTDGFAADAGDALQWGQQANQSGISISTMGLGAEFNDALLIALADDSGGQAYLIEEPAGMAAIFAEELAAARTVALRSLALKLKLYGGVELRHAFRVRPTIGDLGTPVLPDGSVVLPLGDLQADAPPAVLLELVVPPRPPGRYRLAQASLAHAAWDGRAGSEVNADLVVEVRSHVDEASAGNPQVLNLAETVNVFRLQTRALVDAQQGNIAAATMKLRAAATRLLGLGQEELAQAALREAETLDQEGRLSGSGTKKLRYETRKLTQRLD